MLMAPPPGYSPAAIGQGHQSVQAQPGIGGKAPGAFAPGMPALSQSPLAKQQQMQMLLMALAQQVALHHCSYHQR